MTGILIALGWVIFYWVCWVMLATVAFGVVASVGMLILEKEGRAGEGERVEDDRDEQG